MFRPSLAIPALLLVLGVSDGLALARSRPQLVLQLTEADLQETSNAAWTAGFDLSPDGSQVAVAFGAGNAKEHSIWVGVWDISTKRLVSKREVEGPTPITELHAGITSDVRYTPDGNTLVVQTGLHLLLLHARDLTKVMSFGPLQLPTVSRYGPFIRRFDISGDGRWLAVLTGAGRDSRPRTSGVQLIDLVDGKVRTEFLTHNAPGEIALSQDGSQVLLSRFDELGSSTADVLLVDPSTRKVVRGFQSGCPYMDACGASDARFWGKDRIVTVPKPATGSHGEPLAEAMRIFDLDSGRLIRELDRPRWPFLSIGSITIASHAPVVLTVSFLPPSKPELVAFKLEDGDSRTVIGPVLRGQQSRGVEDQYCLRISKDGSLVAFFHDKAIRVYRLSPRDLFMK